MESVRGGCGATMAQPLLRWMLLAAGTGTASNSPSVFQEYNFEYKVCLCSFPFGSFLWSSGIFLVFTVDVLKVFWCVRGVGKIVLKFREFEVF